MLKKLKVKTLIYMENKIINDIISIYVTLIVSQEDVQEENNDHYPKQLSVDGYDKVFHGWLSYS